MELHFKKNCKKKWLIVTRLYNSLSLGNFRYTPLATSACYSIAVLYASHLFAILACWFGITRELSSWIVPKIVLKCTTVVILIVMTCILTYFILNNPRYIGGAIARGLNVDYLEHKSAIDFGTVVLVTVTAALAMGQIWLLLLIIGCYRETRQKELRRLLEKALRNEKLKENERKRSKKGGWYDVIFRLDEVTMTEIKWKGYPDEFSLVVTAQAGYIKLELYRTAFLCRYGS
ncbi:unnamed protein product [Haemonchus placei]|uniref:Uncharacterized protein n=1 Tax=Haemonchus placei TaxID=6290 RepID=A0A0N4W9E3_HAEPC|nr:unnamed protein product [Haemonchus placei]